MLLSIEGGKKLLGMIFKNAQWAMATDVAVIWILCMWLLVDYGKELFQNNKEKEEGCQD